ncbi:MAG: hypothetical protein ACI8RZ_003907 [Myxococcota bacterium]|jgi:hypothetical protein
MEHYLQAITRYRFSVVKMREDRQRTSDGEESVFPSAEKSTSRAGYGPVQWLVS